MIAKELDIMERGEMKRFEKLLLEEKKSREDSLFEDKLGLDVSIRDATSELSSYDNHPGDLGNETFEAEKNFSFRTSDKYVLSEIENALGKIDDGTYGKCEHCKSDIPEERLEIRPYTRFCMSCEKEYELGQNDEEDGRPVEEKTLYPPFGRSFRDNSLEDEVGFDGEDTWQAVNVYNSVTYDNDYDKDDSFGYVEDVEKISNEQYRKSLE